MAVIHSNIADAEETLATLIFLPVIEAVDLVKAGENPVLPGMIIRTILCEDMFTSRVHDGMQIGPLTGNGVIREERVGVFAVWSDNADDKIGFCALKLDLIGKGGCNRAGRST